MSNGYTLLLSSIATHGLVPNLYRNPGCDLDKDFSPITLLAVAPTVLVFNNSTPFKGAQDFAAAAA